MSVEDGATIAVMDTSEEIADMLEQLLRSEGFCAIRGFTTDFKRGRESLDEFLTRHNPRVIIWDIAIPYTDNWDYFNDLQRTGTFAGRSVVLTTTNKRALEGMVGEINVHEIVGKPYDLEELVGAVRRALDRQD